MGQRNAEVDLAADELRIRLPIGTASSAIAFGAMYCEQLSRAVNNLGRICASDTDDLPLRVNHELRSSARIDCLQDRRLGPTAHVEQAVTCESIGLNRSALTGTTHTRCPQELASAAFQQRARLSQRKALVTRQAAARSMQTASIGARTDSTVQAIVRVSLGSEYASPIQLQPSALCPPARPT